MLRLKGGKLKKTPEELTAEAIRLLFPEIEAFTLPCPHALPQVLQHIDDHTRNLRPEFEEGVHNLVSKLISKCRERPKRGFSDSSKVVGRLWCQY